MARRNRVAAGIERSHLLYGGLLVAAVIGTLLLAAWLQADDDLGRTAAMIERPGPGGAAAGAEAPAGAPAEETPPPDPVEAALALSYHGDDDLADRAAEDERRLHASGNGYTLQFAVLCDEANARGWLERFGGEHGLYLLTTVLDDRVCFRLCWGFYDNERQAVAARDVPLALREVTPSPKVLSIIEALP